MILKKTHPLDNGPIQLEGLVDCGKISVKCSNCNKPLFYIWKTRPDEHGETVFAKTKCPLCGDHAYEVKVDTGYHLGHSEFCTIESLDIDDKEKTVVTVIKGGVKYDD